MKSSNKYTKTKTNEYTIANGHVEFKTTRGKLAYIDVFDLYLLEHFFWGVNTKGYLHSRIDGSLIRMHRFILNPKDDEEIDHINGNPLDNRKCNLRICSRQQNGMNLKKAKNNTSGHTGVYWFKNTEQWVSAIHHEGKQVHLGLYNEYEDALRARLKAEEEYYKEYAPNRELLGNG